MPVHSEQRGEKRRAPVLAVRGGDGSRTPHQPGQWNRLVLRGTSRCPMWTLTTSSPGYDLRCEGGSSFGSLYGKWAEWVQGDVIFLLLIVETARVM